MVRHKRYASGFDRIPKRGVDLTDYHYQEGMNFAVMIAGELAMDFHTRQQIQLKPRILTEHKEIESARRSAAFYALGGRATILVDIHDAEVISQYPAINPEDLPPYLGTFTPGSTVTIDGLPAMVMDCGGGWMILVSIDPESQLAPNEGVGVEYA